jgi:hypothetical protein
MRRPVRRQARSQRQPVERPADVGDRSCVRRGEGEVRASSLRARLEQRQRLALAEEVEVLVAHGRGQREDGIDVLRGEA